MQFPCARCGRAYEIADELVVGRAVKVACPACGNLVVHRVPAPGAGSARPPAPPPRPPELTSAFADADDDDFDNALAALEGPSRPPAPEVAAPPARPPAAAPPPAPPRAAAGAAARAASPPPASAAPKAAPARPAARPPTRLPAAPPDDELSDDDLPTVAAALVRGQRRSRMTAAALAIVAVGALAGVGTMGLKWKRAPPAAAQRGADAAAGAEAPSGGGLSAADLAKLMGKTSEPEAAARAPAPAPRASDRPRHEKLPVGDKGLLDLLGKKGDVAVTVQDEDAVALATTRGSLDSDAIEGTLSRNSGSIAACVNRALAADPEQRLPVKRVNLELTIRPSGRVQKSAVAEKAVAATPLGVCIAQAGKRMVFPGFDGEPLDIVVPLKLQVGF